MHAKTFTNRYFKKKKPVQYFESVAENVIKLGIFPSLFAVRRGGKLKVKSVLRKKKKVRVVIGSLRKI